MKRSLILILLGVVQLIVLTCLAMALMRQTLAWFVAAAASVTLLMALAVAFALTAGKGTKGDPG